MTCKIPNIEFYIVRCGISVPIDGSEDDQIHIQDLEEYAIEEEVYDYTNGDPFSDIRLLPMLCPPTW